MKCRMVFMILFTLTLIQCKEDDTKSLRLSRVDTPNGYISEFHYSDGKLTSVINTYASGSISDTRILTYKGDSVIIDVGNGPRIEGSRYVRVFLSKDGIPVNYSSTAWEIKYSLDANNKVIKRKWIYKRNVAAFGDSLLSDFVWAGGNVTAIHSKRYKNGAFTLEEELLTYDGKSNISANNPFLWIGLYTSFYRDYMLYQCHNNFITAQRPGYSDAIAYEYYPHGYPSQGIINDLSGLTFIFSYTKSN